MIEADAQAIVDYAERNGQVHKAHVTPLTQRITFTPLTGSRYLARPLSAAKACLSLGWSGGARRNRR